MKKFALIAILEDGSVRHNEPDIFDTREEVEMLACDHCHSIGVAKYFILEVNDKDSERLVKIEKVSDEILEPQE